MNDVLGALILGIVQGLTEFAPVSSTAHLALVPWIFGWQSPLLNSLAFDIALHMGTLLATLTYFRSEWLRLIRAGLASIRDRSLAGDPWRRLAWLLVLATIPGATAGFLLQSKIESEFRAPWVIGIAMIVMGIVLLAAEKLGDKRLGLFDIRIGTALAIGLGQAAALIPGVSRSGGTMTAALFAGVDRESAARFSFLLATPIIAGAGLKEVREILHVGTAGDSGLAILVGFVTSAIVGYLCIKYLIRYLQTGTLYVFVWYRIVVGMGVLALYLLRG